MPTPFQLAHINKRLRDIALGEQALWRRASSLHIKTRVPMGDGRLRLVSRPYRFGAHPAPDGRRHPRDANHLALQGYVGKLSADTLEEFSFESVDTSVALAGEVLAVARRSAGSLRSLSLVDHGSNGRIAHLFMDLIRCPALRDLALQFGNLRRGRELQELAEVSQTLVPQLLEIVKPVIVAIVVAAIANDPGRYDDSRLSGRRFYRHDRRKLPSSTTATAAAAAATR